MRKTLLIIIVISGLLIAIWLGCLRQNRSIGLPSFVKKAPLNTDNEPSLPNDVREPSQHNEQIATELLSQTEIDAEVTRRDRSEPKWEWKTPIQFYGKVVDENLSPVGDAKVHFQWTDLSAHGTSEADSSSDGQGNFSLDGVHGKRLLVRVTKPGYYASNSNAGSFEFANPFEEMYYRPSKTKPVLFYLRKKGEGAQLIKKSIQVVLPGDGSGANVDLATGKISASGQLEVHAWKPWPPRPLLPHYDWKVTFAIPDGGLVEAPEQFAFEAPEAGYKPSFELNMLADAGAEWKIEVEKAFYFSYGQPRRYGRLNFRTDGHSRYVFINYVFNPSGSRNLEEASNNTVKNGN
jgi:hypothetical protein